MINSIIQSDLECWTIYPHFRWVYESSRLFESQNLKWSPIRTDIYCRDMPNLTYIHALVEPGIIYSEILYGDYATTEICIVNGEIKDINSIDLYHNKIESGSLNLKFNSYVLLHFKKFTGVISCTTCGTVITQIKLRPTYHLEKEKTAKLYKKIFKS